MKKLVTFSLLLLFAIPIFGQDLQFIFSTLSGKPQIINQRLSGGSNGTYCRNIGFIGNAESNGTGRYIANAEFSITGISIPPNSIISLDVSWGFQIAPGVTFTLAAFYQGREVSSKMMHTGMVGSSWVALSLDQLSSPVNEMRIILSSSQADQTFFASVSFWIDNLRYNFASQNPILVYSFENDVVTAVEKTASIPTTFRLEQNYPNPFNPSTTINFSIPKSGDYTLIVYDILGKVVEVLGSGQLSAGNHSVQFNASSSMASDVYFYQLRGDGVSITKKMILMK